MDIFVITNQIIYIYSGKFSGISDLLNRSKQGANIMMHWYIIRKHNIWKLKLLFVESLDDELEQESSPEEENGDNVYLFNLI